MLDADIAAQDDRLLEVVRPWAGAILKAPFIAVMVTLGLFSIGGPIGLSTAIGCLFGACSIFRIWRRWIEGIALAALIVAAIFLCSEAARAIAARAYTSMLTSM